MFIFCLVISHVPRASTRDFHMLILAPVVASYASNVSFIICMSATEVRNMVTSSAYPTTDVGAFRLPILTPLRFFSRDCINGLRHMTNSSMLSGHPCLIELFIGMRRDRKPFISISDYAVSYSRIIC